MVDFSFVSANMLWAFYFAGDCAGGWQSNFGNEYCAYDDKRTNANARSVCQSRNSELANITGDTECDYVAGLM